MEEKVVNYLIKNNIKITTVESCTGGMIASEIVNVSGASSIFEAGFVTYSEKAKCGMVGVSMDTITKYNVVSEEVAGEMAKGGAMTAKADLAISVTGVAGPGGGTKDIPVGTVCFGIYYKEIVKTYKFMFAGDRMDVRRSAVIKAFELLADILEI